MATACNAACAEDYPARTVRIMVPNGAGGSVDLVARAVATRLETELGQAFIVENRTGAAGAIGAEIVRAAAADGYYLLAASSATNTIIPHTQASVRYDGVRDFAPIANLAWTTKMIIVHPSLPVHTVAELVLYAKARPGVLNYSSTGVGSSTHLDAEMFATRAGIQLVNVPYRTPAQQNAAVVANEVQLNIGSITSAIGSVRAGRVRALAVIAAQRSPLLPDVPTIAEAGMPDLEIRTWVGLAAPANTPALVIATLNRAVNIALADPVLRMWMYDQGLEPIGGSAESFRETLERDDAKWKRESERLGMRE
ncbi:MAG: tripartite tricarboxylate transporter substrate binding protein [Betaproteobacteria bacterium]